MSKKSNIACFYNLTCKNCKRACFVKQNKSGFSLYVCSEKPREHKIVDGKKCRKFSCNMKGTFDACKLCKGGNFS